MSRHGKGTRIKQAVPDDERCETENIAQIRAKRCPKKAVATVAHPDLGRSYRCCKTHANSYTSAVQMATGWRVTWDGEAKGAE